MRYRIKKSDRELIFSILKYTCGTWRRASDQLKISSKTLTRWKTGVGSIPDEALEKILSITRCSPPSSAEKLTDYWYASGAGQIGGKITQRLYGNPGTPNGRRKGGLKAIKTHNSNPQSHFKKEKLIQIPNTSAELAEIIGIFFGDGHVGKYQASITLHSETDLEYSKYVAQLVKKNFSITPLIKKKTDKKAIDIVISSIAFIRFLTLKGMVAGNKIRNGLPIPEWIKAKRDYTKAFLRGLFDTDGCIYLDKHVIRKKKYYNLGWTITSHSDILIVDIQEALKKLGFCPTHSIHQHSVFLRKHTEIVRYFESISTSNPKHRNRFQQFIKEKSHSG